MRSRRKNSIGEVSLFSFQDIITATAGIMILLVLLFSLIIATSPAAEQDFTEEPSAKEFDEPIINYDEIIEQLQARLQYLREQEEAFLRQSVLKALQDQTDKPNETLESLRAEHKRVIEHLRASEQMQEQQEQERLDLKAQIRDAVSIRRLTLESDDPRMRRAIIVEFSDAYIKSGKFGTDQIHEHENLAALLTYIQDNPRLANRPVAIFAKASAGYAPRFFANTLGEMGRTVGIDPLEENAHILAGSD